MQTVAQLIEQLHSKDAHARLAACEEMHVLRSLPEEALRALEHATHDADREIAEVAQRALRAHVDPVTPPAEGAASSPVHLPSAARRFGLGCGAGLVGMLIAFVSTWLSGVAAEMGVQAVWVEIPRSWTSNTGEGLMAVMILASVLALAIAGTSSFLAAFRTGRSAMAAAVRVGLSAGLLFGAGFMALAMRNLYGSQAGAVIGAAIAVLQFLIWRKAVGHKGMPVAG